MILIRYMRVANWFGSGKGVIFYIDRVIYVRKSYGRK